MHSSEEQEEWAAVEDLSEHQLKREVIESRREITGLKDEISNLKEEIRCLDYDLSQIPST